MNPQETCWKAVVQPGAVLTAVERRLMDAGALVELRQLHGLSAQEADVLIHREIHAPTNGGSPSGCPHDVDGTVAA